VRRIPKPAMRRSWTPGQPDFLIDAWTPGPSLTFQDSMRTVLPGPKRQEYTPLIPQEALIFWTSTDVNILRAFASVNPEFLASLCICPFAANEALTECKFITKRFCMQAFASQVVPCNVTTHSPVQNKSSLINFNDNWLQIWRLSSD